MNEQIQWNNTEVGNDAYYYVKSDNYITLTGFLGNSNMDKENDLGNLINIKVKLNEKINDTCTIGLVSLDGKKLENNEKSLSTTPGKVRNLDQIWNEEKTITGEVGWGKAQALVQFIKIEAKLKF